LFELHQINQEAMDVGIIDLAGRAMWSKLEWGF
jgi:hypothetical protein